MHVSLWALLVSLVPALLLCSADFCHAVSCSAVLCRSLPRRALLALRSLRMVPSDGCSLPLSAQVLEPNVSIAACDELP